MAACAADPTRSARTGASVRAHRPIVGRYALALGLTAVVVAPSAHAQMIDDGLLVPRRELRVGFDYGQDRWDQYWEGGLRRSNGNIGTLNTRSVTGTAAYGVNARLSVFATLPYVWTEASAGVLHGMQGRQDLTVAARYRVLETRIGGRATLATLVTGGVGAPTSNYTPDFLPLSIGLGTRRALARVNFRIEDRSGWYLDADAGHTWRSNVHLDRSAYYTEGRLYATNEVAMPEVAEYGLAGGYQRGRLCFPLAIVTQRTLGGADIRKQDMPFVSNRMNSTRLQSHAMYTLPRGLIVDAGVMQTIAGRNVGRSTMFTGGFAYAFHL